MTGTQGHLVLSKLESRRIRGTRRWGEDARERRRVGFGVQKGERGVQEWGYPKVKA